MKVKITFEAMSDTGEPDHAHSVTFEGGKMSYDDMQNLQKGLANFMFSLGDANMKKK